ncbi:MAG: nitrilase-related carbon-nitrogen hydrolase [Candidatus Krumholzibacteriia bacterium]
MRLLTVAAVQMDLVWEDRTENFRRARRWAHTAAAAGADLVVLPEMFATGFSMNPAVTAEAPDGPTPSFLRELARDLGLTVIGGYVRKAAADRALNAALTVGPDGEDLAEYHKTHLVGILGEPAVHQAGHAPRPFPLAGVRACCFICYDLRFPELFRLTASDTALAVVIASWPEARQAHWDALLVARAIENQQFVVGVNRVGEGGGLGFTGGTVIIDPLGKILAQGGPTEGLVTATLDLDQVAEVRGRFPFLADRRF